MIGSEIVYLDRVDSTNNYAAQVLLTKSPAEGTVISAGCQFAGKGQVQASWESEVGKNLTFSVILYPVNLEVHHQFSLSKAITLGLTDYLTGLLPGITVKWPNDIYAGDGKLAGILVEVSVVSGRLATAIAGIGLNVNQEHFVSDAPNPVSLKNLTGRDFDLAEVLNGLCGCLDKRYRMLLEGAFDRIDRDYLERLYRRGGWASYRDNAGVFEGMIECIGPFGELRVKTRSGEQRSYDFKEISFL